MVTKLPTRFAHPKRDFAPQNKGEFDISLDKAIKNLERVLPEEWEIVLQYIRSLALPLPMEPNEDKKVVAEYHKKALATQIARRLCGFEKI